MLLRLGSPLVALPVVPLLLVALVSAPARASSLTLRDPEGDVYRLRTVFDLEPVGSVPNADLTSTSITFHDGLLSVSAHYTRLRPGPSDELDYAAELRTETAAYVVQVVVDHTLTTAHVDLLPAGVSGSLDCPEASATVDARGDMVSFTVPATCLDQARWVRFRGTTTSYSRHGHALTDNAMGPSARARTFTGRIHDR